MSNEDHKRRVLERLGVMQASSSVSQRTPHDPQKLYDMVFESKQRHGHGHVADRAHLEEMLARDDIPQFLRGHMQQALNRHLHRERMEAFVQKSTT